MRISDWSSDVCSSDLNVEVRADACRRLAGTLEVRLEDIVFAANGPRLVAIEPAPTAAPETGPTLVPRFDTDIASFTQDENKLFKLASENSELVSERSEEHTSELQSLMRISYAVFCLKKKIINHITP